MNKESKNTEPTKEEIKESIDFANALSIFMNTMNKQKMVNSDNSEILVKIQNLYYQYIKNNKYTPDFLLISYNDYSKVADYIMSRVYTSSYGELRICGILIIESRCIQDGEYCFVKK